MCTIGTNCLCHLLKKVIEGDKSCAIRDYYFKPTLRVDLYDFLKLAYSLLKKNGQLLENSNFYKLNNLFIAKDGLESINIAHEDYVRYMNAVYGFIEPYSLREAQVRIELSRLVKKMEKLLYLNLNQSQPEFIEFLRTQDEQQQPDRPCVIL